MTGHCPGTKPSAFKRKYFLQTGKKNIQIVSIQFSELAQKEQILVTTI